MHPVGPYSHHSRGVVRFPAPRCAAEGLSKRVHDPSISLAIWAPHTRAFYVRFFIVISTENLEFPRLGHPLQS